MKFKIKNTIYNNTRKWNLTKYLMQKSSEPMRVIKIQINEKKKIYVCGLEDLIFLRCQFFPTWSVDLIQSLQDIL